MGRPAGTDQHSTAATRIVPRLVVDDPDTMIDVYERVLGAELLDRAIDTSVAPDHVTNATLRAGDSFFTLTAAHPEWGLVAPTDDPGASVLLRVMVPDPDGVAAAFVSEGGSVVVDIEDRPWGRREGRVIDRAGHRWIVSRYLDDAAPR